MSNERQLLLQFGAGCRYTDIDIVVVRATLQETRLLIELKDDLPPLPYRTYGRVAGVVQAPQLDVFDGQVYLTGQIVWTGVNGELVCELERSEVELEFFVRGDVNCGRVDKIISLQLQL